MRAVHGLTRTERESSPREVNPRSAPPATTRHRRGWLAALALPLALAGGIAGPAAAAIGDGPNVTVNAVARGADGTTYIGGAFTWWGAQTGGMAVLDAVSASVNRNFPMVVGTVNAVAADGAGGWYIGGSFTKVGELDRTNLAHVESTGAVATWNPSANNTVYALAVSGGTVYVGGAFTTIGCASGCSITPGTPRNRLAAIGTDGTLSDWNPSANNTVYALAVSDSTVYVGGSFNGANSINGTLTRNRLAAVDVTTGTATAWDPNAGPTGTAVYALAVSGGTVYVGGDFTTIGGTATRNRLAAIGTNGTLSEAWDPNAGPTSTAVYALAVSGDGNTVYVGGSFTTIGGTSARNRLAAIGTNGTLSSWDPNAGPTGTAVRAVAVSGDGPTVCAGGGFTSVGGTARSRLAAILADGTLSTTWNPGANDTVYALAVSGSTVYVGGDFTSLGCSPGCSFSTTIRNHLAAIGTDGTLSDWNPSADNTVYALAVSGSTVYAGGAFVMIGPTIRRYVAAISTDGTLAAWDPYASGSVNALAVSGSTVYLGGAFTTIGSGATPPTRNRLAAIGTDGALATWDPNASGTVRALAVSGSTVYVGGAFNGASSINGTLTRNRLAAVDATTGTATAWNPDAASAGSFVYALTVSGSTVYAGGNFTIISSELRSGSSSAYFARLYAGPCGAGIGLAAGRWQMLGLPCVPSIGTHTVADTFGANFTKTYGDVSNGWILFQRDAGDNSNSVLQSTTVVTTGNGYWIKTLTAPVNPEISISGTATVADTTLAGCASSNGCVAVPVSTVSGQSRYNLVGNPFPFDVDWAKVRVEVNDSGTYSYYSPSQAALPANNFLSKQIWIYNSTSSAYDTYDDVTTGSIGNLLYFKSFWVKALPDAAGKTVRLLIPSEETTHAQGSTLPPRVVGPGPTASALTAGGREGGSMGAVSSSTAAQRTALPPSAAREWFVRLKVENPATGARHDSVMLGQRAGASAGYDPSDLAGMAPFAAPYLMLSFPHPDWGDRKGDYATDFHPAEGMKADRWDFEVRADPVGSKVVLGWEGDPAILQRSLLIDVEAGRTIVPAAGRYTLTLTGKSHRFTWRYLGAMSGSR